MSDAPLASMVLHGMEACLLVPFFLWVGAQLGLEQPLERAWAEAVAMQQPQWFAERALAVLMGSYLVLGFGCLALDILSPKFLQRLRAQAVQRRNWELFSLQPGSLGKLFAVLTLNIGVGSVVGLKSGSLARLVEPLIRPGLPSARECCLHFIALELVYEVMFYYSHRLFHHPTLYARVHKVHHEWKAPTALAASYVTAGTWTQYAHPLEHAVSNVGPGFMGALLLRPHFLTFVAYSWIGLVSTLCAHSGYELVPGSNCHDKHHQYFDRDYGHLGILDWLHGTHVLCKAHAPRAKDL